MKTAWPHRTGIEATGAQPVSHFVVQDHQARTHHYDFRLEKNGVLKSWAVPKGPPLAWGEKRLAVQTEDHPRDYADFEGTILPGRYGAGQVRIWDRGLCEVREWTDERIVFVLHGRRLRGCFGLLRMRQLGPRHWLFLSMQRGRTRPHPVRALPDHLPTTPTSPPNQEDPS
ncbi:MAG: ATP-dependent DNA ligase [Opitutae bacterium]|nr:ATP-dependent DNA ligase [Opitutae bacterium]